MTFYLRKSFKMGPMRLNLSKSGLGVSAGVTGARIGINSQGRTYVHAGRRGLYYRKSLGGGAARSPGRTQPEPYVLYERTDVTFASDVDRFDPDAATPNTSLGNWMLPVFGFPITAFLVGAMLDDPVNVILAWGGFALGVLFLVLALLRFIAYRLFTSALNRLLKRGWSEQDWARAAERSESALLGDKITRSTFERTYVHACQSMVADGVVDDDEIRFLHKVESAVGTVTPVMHSSKSDAFRGLVFAAATDPEFDEADEGILDELRDQLGLDAEALGAGTTLRERLKRLRAIRSGELPVVRPSVPIQKSETCYYEGVGRFLKEKQLQSFQRDGVRYKVRGLAIDKEGLLLITNKRTLLVHSGTSSVRHDKVFDVEVDLDENMVSITKDGSQTPTLITTPDALEAGALIARLSGA